MRLSAVNRFVGCDLVHKIERRYAKRNLRTITSSKDNKYVIRAEHNQDKYVKTTLTLDNNGRVNNVRSTFMPDPDKFKEELLLFVSK